jgi:mRNA-degrading endonuclease YafQ of YafQ-DinJ toxin-antitoxin module
MFKLIETKTYKRKLKKFLKKHPGLFKKYQKTVFLLESNPFHPSLRLHKLKGEMQEFHSVSIDMSYRIIIDFIVIDEKILMIDIGEHEDVYQ